MRRHIRSLAVLLPAGLLLAGILPAQTRQAVTIPFPRGGRGSVGLTNGPMLIRSVELKGRPSAREIRRARRDRDDKTTLRWIFRVANAGRRDWHARIRVRVLAPGGEVLASNDREGEVNARDWHDHITVWTRIRTIDYARADRVLIEADFYPD
jgi:hypothetical protein